MAAKKLSQKDIVLGEILKLGGKINTFELMNLNPRVSQYQRVLKELREKFEEEDKGWALSEGVPHPRLKGCFVYTLTRPIAPPKPQPVAQAKPQPNAHQLQFGSAA